ncbi:MAG: AAA family ATPase, partial [Desulfovibrionaceae bacterium]|nr:AAA family ATPase [Desulfovibrionaceae bacterium]
MSENRILVGTQSFRKFREQGKVYVDKTAFINEFLSGELADVSLITRPRRFGKSLLLDMLAEFFDRTKNSREIFDGLAVSQDKKLCAKWMNKYPVIYLSLNEIKADSFEIAYTLFKNTASSICD